MTQACCELIYYYDSSNESWQYLKNNCRCSGSGNSGYSGYSGSGSSGSDPWCSTCSPAAASSCLSQRGQPAGSSGCAAGTLDSNCNCSSYTQDPSVCCPGTVSQCRNLAGQSAGGGYVYTGNAKWNSGNSCYCETSHSCTQAQYNDCSSSRGNVYDGYYYTGNIDSSCDCIRVKVDCTNAEKANCSYASGQSAGNGLCYTGGYICDGARYGGDDCYCRCQTGPCGGNSGYGSSGY